MLKSPLTFLVLACIFYAILNVTLQKKMAVHHAIMIAVMVNTATIMLSWGAFTATRKISEFPEMNVWKWGLLCGLLIFLADISYFHAYTLGVTATTATTMFILVPVFATAITAIVFGEQPNRWDYLSFILAAGAVVAKAIAMTKREGGP